MVSDCAAPWRLTQEPYHRPQNMCTALHYAGGNHHKRVVKALLDNGADPKLRAFVRASQGTQHASGAFAHPFPTLRDAAEWIDL